MDGPGEERRRIVVEVLGPVGARVAATPLDIGGPRQRALLAMLAHRIGRVVSTDALVDAVWDGAPPNAAERTFRTYVARLRKALTAPASVTVDGTDLVSIEQPGYRLDGRHVSVDADRFEQQLGKARDRLSTGEPSTAVALLDEALELWRGPAYGQFADRPWIQPEALRLEELRVATRELRLQALLDAGRTDEVVADLDALAADHPHRESLVRLQVLTRYRSGRHADAIGVIREFRQRLAGETGLDASAQLDELERMVLDQDPRLDRPIGGRRLRGYVLHEVVAETSAGAIHRAEQRSIGRQVAITVLPADRADEPAVVRAFEARAQQVAAVEHAHVVPLYDFWREPGGAYIVTRFPAGGTLAQRLARGPVTESEVVSLVAQVGGGLAAAHARGVAHGSVDARSVLLDERGDAFLAAFPPVADPTATTHDLGHMADLVDALVDAIGDVDARVAVAARVHAVTAAARDAADDRIVTVAALVEEVLARLGDEAVGLVVPAAVGTNPYRGLAAFDETDADVFFGQDRLVTEVLGRLSRQPFLAVSGPSGAGKSSVVRAGVLPRLRADGAYVTTMVPGPTPLAELVVALSRIAASELSDDLVERLAAGDLGLTDVLVSVLPEPDAEAVLVVDQFEELFTLASDGERDAFLGALVGALEHPLRRLRVIATVRADFLGQVLADRIAGAIVHDRTVLARPMTADELHEVVVGPAEVAGVAVEPELATTIVADAVRSAGSLPMMQFALTEVYEAADDGTMTLAAYRRLGGIEGVLGQRAEEVYAGLDDVAAAEAQAMFRRLVVPNDDGPPARRRARRSELAGVSDEVVETFGAARLLRFDHDDETREPTVEVTHEALFREWPRLVAWIDAGVDDLRLLGHLTASAEDWDVGGRDDAELYRGNRLDSALAFAAGRSAELTAGERDFLEAARRRRVRAARAEQATLRRLRTLTGGLALGLVLALVAGGLAWASRQQEASVRAAAQADAVAFAAEAAVQDDLALGMLLAAESYAIRPGITSQGALLGVLGEEPRVERLIPPDPLGICGTQPDQADVNVTQVTDPAGDDDVVLVEDFARREIGRVPIAPGSDCPSVDRTGQHVYIAFPLTGTLDAVDVATGEVVASRSDWGERVRFSPVGHSPTAEEALLVTDEGRLERISTPDLATLEELEPPEDVELALVLPTYSETGRSVAATTGTKVVVFDDDGRARVSDAVTDSGDFIYGASIAEQAGVLFAMGEAGLYVADLDDLRDFMPVRLRGQFSGLGFAVVHPDGDRVAVATSQGIELLALPGLEPIGEPISIETGIGTMTWGTAGQLYWNGPTGIITIDTERTLALGEVLAPPTDTGFALFPAADGRSAVRFDPGARRWVDLESGRTEVIATDDDDFTVVQALLSDKALLRVDLATSVVERWDGGEVVTSTPLPVELPPMVERNFSIMRVDHGRAVVVTSSLGGEVDQWVITLDEVSGEVLSMFELPRTVGDELQPITIEARAVGSDRLLLNREDSTSVIVDLAGDVVVEPTLVVQGGEVTGVSHDGALIAIAGFRGEIALAGQDLETVAVLEGGTESSARTLRFVEDGRLVSRHNDGLTLVWDLDQRLPIGTLFSSEGELPYSFESTPDGEAIVHTTAVGTVRIPLDPDHWLDTLCRPIDRALTPAELEAVAPGLEPLDPCMSGGAAGNEASP